MTTRILALDISSHAGYALLENAESCAPVLIEKGIVTQGKPVFEYGRYPWCYYSAAAAQAQSLLTLCETKRPDVIVVEETNLGKNRYSQKLLEFIHAFFLFAASHSHIIGTEDGMSAGLGTPIVYLSSSAWRSALGMQMSKEDKKANAALSKAKRVAASTGGKLDKASLGIKGKVTKKHLAIRWVNEQFGLQLKIKDNDEADAICLAMAFLKGATRCDGT